MAARPRAANNLGRHSVAVIPVSEVRGLAKRRWPLPAVELRDRDLAVQHQHNREENRESQPSEPSAPVRLRPGEGRALVFGVVASLVATAAAAVLARLESAAVALLVLATVVLAAASASLLFIIALQRSALAVLTDMRDFATDVQKSTKELAREQARHGKFLLELTDSRSVVTFSSASEFYQAYRSRWGKREADWISPTSDQRRQRTSDRALTLGIARFLSG